MRELPADCVTRTRGNALGDGRRAAISEALAASTTHSQRTSGIDRSRDLSRNVRLCEKKTKKQRVRLASPQPRCSTPPARSRRNPGGERNGRNSLVLAVGRAPALQVGIISTCIPGRCPTPGPLGEPVFPRVIVMGRLLIPSSKISSRIDRAGDWVEPQGDPEPLNSLKLKPFFSF